MSFDTEAVNFHNTDTGRVFLSINELILSNKARTVSFHLWELINVNVLKWQMSRAIC
jgi:hypothetical protein